jgi:hypothetical protein
MAMGIIGAVTALPSNFEIFESWQLEDKETKISIILVAEMCPP